MTADRVLARAVVEELLGRGFLAMAFQPIFEDGARRPYGYEALLRGPANTPLESPQPLFHDPGLISEDLLLRLDLACIGAAVRSGRRLADSAFLFVNVHGRTLEALVRRDHVVYRLIDSLRIAASRIVLEVSESTPVTDVRDVARHLSGLRSQGLRIAVDDAGTASPWLEHLLWLEPDFVKLDREFISGIAREPKKRDLVGGLACLARRLGARLVAEGVETAEELAALRGIGVPLVQGYLLGRPAPAESFLPSPLERAEPQPPPALLLDPERRPHG